KKQHHQKERRESRKRGGERAAAVAEPGGGQHSGKSEHGPETEHGKRAELARGRQARIVTERNGGPNSTNGPAPCVRRLDARARVRADVSDTLLRLVDESGGQKIFVADCLVAAGWDTAGAAIHFFGVRVVCAGDGKVAREGNRAGRDREADDIARGGDFWDGIIVSRAGICARLSVVAVDGFVARRRSEYPWAFHDAHGSAVLGHGRRRRRD